MSRILAESVAANEFTDTEEWIFIVLAIQMIWLDHQRKDKNLDGEGKPIAAVAVYCGSCGYHIIAKDHKSSMEHRTTINLHIKSQHSDERRNLRSPFKVGASMNEVYQDFTSEATTKSWQVGARKMGWKGTSEL